MPSDTRVSADCPWGPIFAAGGSSLRSLRLLAIHATRNLLNNRLPRVTIPRLVEPAVPADVPRALGPC